jgi:hypothetical protein
MESPIDAARASMENARAAEVVGRFGSLDLYRQSSLSPPFQAVYNCFQRGYTRNGSDTSGRNGQRFLPETTQAVVRLVPIIPLPGSSLSDFPRRHVGARFHITQKKLCYQNQFLTASC